MSEGPILYTPRLMLRPPRREDFEAWAAFAADPESMRYLGGVQTRAMAWRGLATVIGAWSLRGFSMFSVFERESGAWIGRLGPWQPEDWPGPEVGWALAPEAWGKGYATEGAAATLDWAFDTLGWPEVIHCIDAANEASRRVAERLGASFRRVDHLPEPFHTQPVEIWGQTREEWAQRKTMTAPRDA